VAGATRDADTGTDSAASGRTKRSPAEMAVPDLMTALDAVPASGLTAAEAARRLRRDRPNTLRAAPPVPTWRRALAQFHDPLIHLLNVCRCRPKALSVTWSRQTCR
jgi:Ca2+-transporting ATPase